MPLNLRPAGLEVPQPAPHGDGDERRRGPQLHLRRPARPARQEGALPGHLGPRPRKPAVLPEPPGRNELAPGTQFNR